MRATAAAPLSKRAPLWVNVALLAGCALLFLATMGVAPISIPPYLDFQVLYQANMGLLRGVALYDHAGQANMIAQLAGVAPEQVYVLPFPYPPWYALSTLWLAWLPIEAAARVWMGISLLLVIASSWLLTEGWSPLGRLAAAALAVVFVPVVGSLYVGQYGFPVLFGASLMLCALRHERPALVAVAAALLTFKPHIGVLVLLAVLAFLLLRRSSFSRRALLYIAVAAVVLSAIGFVADPAWPIDYARSLLNFGGNPGVARCDQCSSLPVLVAEALGSHAGLQSATAIAAIILTAVLSLWLLTRRASLLDLDMLIAVPLLIVLLSSPYLLKYDYVLLLVPLAILAGRARSLGAWLLIAAVYLLPDLALALPRRQGDLVLTLCAAMLMVVLYLRKPSLDVSLPAA